MTIKVKPLEWSDNKHGSHATVRPLNRAIISYEVKNIGGKWVLLPCPDRSTGVFDTREQAKQAAQEHFKALVLECIEGGE